MTTGAKFKVLACATGSGRRLPLCASGHTQVLTISGALAFKFVTPISTTPRAASYKVWGLVSSLRLASTHFTQPFRFRWGRLIIHFVTTYDCAMAYFSIVSRCSIYCSLEQARMTMTMTIWKEPSPGQMKIRGAILNNFFFFPWRIWYWFGQCNHV